jgi:putative protein-disulfide isomerase
MKLIYVGDPLCSWCYGFGPQLEALLAERADIVLSIVLGGLRAYQRDPMPAARKAEIGGYWQRVFEMTGATFAPLAAHGAMARDDFVYDTEPPCRAVVTARTLDSARALPMYHAIQAAFYRDGRDVTKSDVLCEVAAENDLDRAAFASALDSESMRAATRTDFETAAGWGIRGFPTLVIENNGQQALLASGFARKDELLERLESVGDL